MGSASSLFYSSNDTEKQTLHRRITPSSDQFEEQQARWNALAEYLSADLRGRSGYSIRTWLQGSYKFGTQTRPVRFGEEFDIDLGIYYVWKGSRDDGDYDPQTLKVRAHPVQGRLPYRRACVSSGTRPGRTVAHDPRRLGRQRSKGHLYLVP